MTTPPRTNADATGRAADGGARQPGAARAATDLVTSIERLREIVGEPTARFFHCAKAFLRSNTWQPPTWSPDVLPSHATIVKAVEGLDESMEDLEAHYGPAYLDLLYAEPAPAS